MSPKEARKVARYLVAAAKKAEAEGRDQIDLLAELRAQDDAARAELAKAIEDAQRQVAG